MDAQTLEAVGDFKRRLGRRYGDRLKAVYVFGSRARGEGGEESDVDVAFFLDGPVDDPLREELALADDRLDVMFAHGLHVQAWAFDAASMESPEDFRDPHLTRALLKEGVAV